MTIKLLIGCIDESLGHSMRKGLEQDVSAGIACEIADLEHVLATAAAMQPDVLLLEKSRSGESTRQVVSRIRRVSPFARTLMLYEVYTHDLIIESIRQGASGCLLKSSDPSLCAKAVCAVHRGETWYGRMALLEALQSQICASPSKIRIDESKLTRREEEILRLIGSGLSNKEIGRQLEISDKTVKTHLHRIYVKLNQSGRYKAYLSKPEAGAAARWAPMSK